MFPEAVNGVLAWLHIFSAIGWMGTAMFIVIVMNPVMSQLTRATKSELLAKLLPKLVRYLAAFSGMTVVFGLLLLYGIAGGTNSLSPDTLFGLSLTLGTVLAFVALGIVHGVVLPSARRIVKLLAQAGAQAEPPELPRLQKRMRTGATAVLALLLLTLAFMVAAGSI